MKITDRIKQLKGIVECKYDFDKKTLRLRYNSSADPTQLYIQVPKMIADLQLQDSVERIEYQNGGTIDMR